MLLGNLDDIPVRCKVVGPGRRDVFDLFGVGAVEVGVGLAHLWLEANVKLVWPEAS